MSGDGVASTISKHSDTAPIGTALTVDDGEGARWLELWLQNPGRPLSGMGGYSPA